MIEIDIEAESRDNPPCPPRVMEVRLLMRAKTTVSSIMNLLDGDYTRSSSATLPCVASLIRDKEETVCVCLFVVGGTVFLTLLSFS